MYQLILEMAYQVSNLAPKMANFLLSIYLISLLISIRHGSFPINISFWFSQGPTDFDTSFLLPLSTDSSLHVSHEDFWNLKDLSMYGWIYLEIGIGQCSLGQIPGSYHRVPLCHARFVGFRTIAFKFVKSSNLASFFTSPPCSMRRSDYSE